MTGIVAAYALDGQLPEDVRAVFRGLFRSRSANEGYSTTIYDSSQVMIGCSGLDGSSAVIDLEDHVTAVFGEVVEPGLTVNVDGAMGPRLIARAAAEQGAAALEGMNGHYVALHWDKCEGRFHAITDRLAGINGYVWESRGVVLAASRLADLMAFPGVSGVMDEQGVADLLTLGCCISGRTLIGGVERLEWASHVTWTRSGRHQRRYWTPAFEGSEPTRPIHAYGDDLAELIREQVKLRAGHLLVLPLSSGYDSRILAAAASECIPRDRMSAYTLGDRHSYDGRYAPAIAHALGLSHELIPIPETFYQDYAADAVQRVDGMVIGHTCWRLAADPFLQRHGGWIVMNGWAGDQFQGVKLLEPMLAQSTLAKQFDLFYNESTAWRVMNNEGLRAILRPEVYRRTENVAYETLRSAYEKAPADNPVQRLDFVNWTLTSPRRYQRMNRDYTEVTCRTHHPFRENAMAQYLQTLPPAVRYKGGIFAEMMARHWPKAARIPSSHGGVPIAAPWMHRQYHRGRGWVRYKAVPALTGGKLRYPNPGTYVHYLDWLRGPNRPYVESVLSDGAFLEDLFDMDGVRTMVSDVMEGRSGDYGKVYNLASLVLFRRRAVRRAASAAA